MRSVIRCSSGRFARCIRAVRESHAKRKLRTFLVECAQTRLGISEIASHLALCIVVCCAAAAKDGCVEYGGIVETRSNCTHALRKSGRCSASSRVVDFQMSDTCNLHAIVEHVDEQMIVHLSDGRNCASARLICERKFAEVASCIISSALYI